MKTWRSNREEKQKLYKEARKLLTESYIQQNAYNLVLRFSPSSAIEEPQAMLEAATIYGFCEHHFPVSLSILLMDIYAAEPRYDEEIRDIALMRLNIILSDHVYRELFFAPFFVVQELGKMLVSCLDEKVMSGKRITYVANVVSHVAYLIFTCYNSVWYDLRDFIASRAETDFKKAVYIFQRLPFPLNSKEFVSPVMQRLLPAILDRLDPSNGSGEYWILSFTGAFALAIHLMGTKRADLVGDLVYQMLKSLTELVSRGTEQRFLREALQKIEGLVKDDVETYNAAEYRFVSGLILRIYGLDGVETETKRIVWSILETLENNTLSPGEERSCAFDDWLK